MSRAARQGSLTTRLLTAQVAVTLAMALTMVVAAALAGPPLFKAHMLQAGHGSPEVLAHSAEAFNAAGSLALLIGLLISGTGAIVVSVLISRRLRRSLTGLGVAAAGIADGNYGHRVDPPDSRELAALADSFNTMAARLDAVETSRRRLLTDLAHELRTPLASLEICVESLADGALEPGPEAWGILASQVRRIERLTDDLTQVSAAEEGRLELSLVETEPVGVAERVVLAAREAFERKRVALDVLPSPYGSVTVQADPARIEQVLANLLSNALRHTPPGGTVTLAVFQADATVAFQVSDDGEGIAAEHLPHVFERFYRADTARDRDRGGTGVGLAISRAIAQAHGGRLTAASAGDGQGSTFTLWLPVGQPNRAARAAGPGAATTGR